MRRRCSAPSSPRRREHMRRLCCTQQCHVSYWHDGHYYLRILRELLRLSDCRLTMSLCVAVACACTVHRTLEAMLSQQDADAGLLWRDLWRAQRREKRTVLYVEHGAERRERDTAHTCAHIHTRLHAHREAPTHTTHIYTRAYYNNIYNVYRQVVKIKKGFLVAILLYI